MNRTIILFFLIFSFILACKNQNNSSTFENNPIPSNATEVKPPTLTNNEETTTNVSYTKTEKESGFKSLVKDYESPDRVIWQKPDVVIQKLGNLTGKTIADVGAGTGYFAFRLVSKADKVIAVDIDRRFINFMDSIKVQLPQEYQNRFSTRLAEPLNANLKKNEVDGVIMANTYTYISNRIAYLQSLKNALKSNGIILIIDYKKKNMPIGPPLNERLAMDVIESELSQAGYEKIFTDDTSLDYQYIVSAVKR